MTTQQLSQRVSFRFGGYGHFRIEIEYRNYLYTALTTNTLALDRVNDNTLVDRARQNGYTRRQALLALYNECKLKNNL